MELKKNERKMKCDIAGCKNISDYVFEFKKQFLAGNMYVCKNCMQQMYGLMGKELVPPSIKNVYKKNNEVEK